MKLTKALINPYKIFKSHSSYSFLPLIPSTFSLFILPFIHSFLLLSIHSFSFFSFILPSIHSFLLLPIHSFLLLIHSSFHSFISPSSHSFISPSSHSFFLPFIHFSFSSFIFSLPSYTHSTLLGPPFLFSSHTLPSFFLLIITPFVLFILWNG